MFPATVALALLFSFTVLSSLADDSFIYPATDYAAPFTSSASVAIIWQCSYSTSELGIRADEGGYKSLQNVTSADFYKISTVPSLSDLDTPSDALVFLVMYETDQTLISVDESAETYAVTYTGRNFTSGYIKLVDGDDVDGDDENEYENVTEADETDTLPTIIVAPFTVPISAVVTVTATAAATSAAATAGGMNNRADADALANANLNKTDISFLPTGLHPKPDPTGISSTTNEPEDSSSQARRKLIIGLAVGLGVGIPLLLGIAVGVIVGRRWRADVEEVEEPRYWIPPTLGNGGLQAEHQRSPEAREFRKYLGRWGN